MDRFTILDFRRLTEKRVGPCVTIYMPTFNHGAGSQQNPLRLKNLLQKAETELSDGWLRPADARKLLDPARELTTDSLFWEQCDLGLAMFITSSDWTCFRLSREFEECMFVNRNFHVKPLVPLLSGAEQFSILALSQKNTRLYEASRHVIRPVEIDGFPKLTASGGMGL